MIDRREALHQSLRVIGGWDNCRENGSLREARWREGLLIRRGQALCHTRGLSSVPNVVAGSSGH
jgi:hypothetical protein